MRLMGNLRKKIPITYGTMFVGTLAIAGIPGLAGFFSKDEILWQTWSHNNRALWAVAFVTALLTAFYMFRLVYLTFFGEARMSHDVEHHVHESPKSMTIPLMVLALGAITVGYLGLPASITEPLHIGGATNKFEKFLEPVFAMEAEGATTMHAALGASGHGELVAGENAAKATEGEQSATAAEHVNQAVKEGEAVPAGVHPAAAHEIEPLEYLLMALSIGAGLVGWFFARRAYNSAGKDYREPINVVAPPVYRTLFNKYYVDELYDYLFTGRRKLGNVRLGAQGLGDALWKFDANVIDGGVNGAGWLTKFTGTASNWWDKWIIDGLLVNGPAIFTKALSLPIRRIQDGLVQWYALVMVVGLVGFVWYYVIR